MSASAAELEAIWHDVECGAYAADLPAWVEIASEGAGPALELGAGTGRVALHLARAGLEVVALESVPALLDQLADRARRQGLELEPVLGDARRLDGIEQLDRRYGAILAPMQFLHLIDDRAERRALLESAARRLASGGVVAAAVLDDDPVLLSAGDGSALLPDVRELDGWVYSSQPLQVAATATGIEIRRLRQTVSPTGDLSEEPHSVHLDGFGAAELEAEAEAAGLRRRRRIEIPATDDHVGSTICVLEAV